MKASDLFIAALEAEEVEYIFAVPGEENLDLLESLPFVKKDGFGAIGHILDEPFVGIDTALIVEPVIAIESGRHHLAHAGIWQEIAGQLLNDELIEGKVSIEGIDDNLCTRIGEDLGFVS